MIQFLRGTSSQLQSSNRIFAAGQPVFESDSGQLKIGDGLKTFANLPYVGASDGSEWSTKDNGKFHCFDCGKTRILVMENMYLNELSSWSSSLNPSWFSWESLGGSCYYLSQGGASNTFNVTIKDTAPTGYAPDETMYAVIQSDDKSIIVNNQYNVYGFPNVLACYIYRLGSSNVNISDLTLTITCFGFMNS